MNWQRIADEVIRRRTHLGYGTRAEFAEATGFATKTLGDLEKMRRTNFDRVTLAKLEKALQWPEGRIDEILTQPEQGAASRWQRVATYYPGADLHYTAIGRTPNPDLLAEPGGPSGDGGRDGAADGEGQFVAFQVKYTPREMAPPRELLWQLGLESPPDPAPGEFTLAELLRLIARDDFALGVLMSRAGLAHVPMLRLVAWVRRRREQQNVELLREVADQIRDLGGEAPDQVWPPVWLVGDAEEARSESAAE